MTSARNDEGAERSPAAEEGAAGRRPSLEDDQDANDGRRTTDDGAEQVETDLEALLNDVTRERDEYLDLARRAKADFDNFRKRAARDTAEAEARGKAGLARALLPSIDNLERAIRAAGLAPGADPAAPGGEQPSEEVSASEALARGIALVHSELEAALARAGVEAYEPAGERFDPNLHEAISTRPPGDGEQSGAVVETLERGYRLGEQVLRPARVVVAD